ncbi:unnamed protein product [Lota lota]
MSRSTATEPRHGNRYILQLSLSPTEQRSAMATGPVRREQCEVTVSTVTAQLSDTPPSLPHGTTARWFNPAVCLACEQQ